MILLQRFPNREIARFPIVGDESGASATLSRNTSLVPHVQLLDIVRAAVFRWHKEKPPPTWQGQFGKVGALNERSAVLSKEWRLFRCGYTSAQRSSLGLK